jgi:hypothetical protein
MLKLLVLGVVEIFAPLIALTAIEAEEHRMPMEAFTKQF